MVDEESTKVKCENCIGQQKVRLGRSFRQNMEHQYEVGTARGERESERELGQGGGRAHSFSAWNQQKKSIFNLAMRIAKLVYLQLHHGLNYTKLPPRKER